MKKMKIIKNLAFGLLGVGAVSTIVPFVVSCGSDDKSTSDTNNNPVGKPHTDNSGVKPNTDSGSAPNVPETPTEPDGGDVQLVQVNDQTTLEMLAKKFPSGITSHGFKYRIVQKHLENPTNDF